MNWMNTRKSVAVLSAFFMLMNQVVVSGFAAQVPTDELRARSVPSAPEKPAPVQASSTIPVARPLAQTSSGFLADQTPLSVSNLKAAQESTLRSIKVPPAVSSLVSELQEKLKSQGFRVTVTNENLKKSQYLITLTQANGKQLWGGLKTLSVVVDSQGRFQSGSIQANYNGIKFVEGSLLFEALGQLPQIPEGMSVRNLVNMTQLTVKEADSKKGIIFELGKDTYIAYRDVQGRVRIEKVLPPAVQSFVDQLKKQLKKEFELKVEGVKRHPGDPVTYRITVTDSKVYSQKPTSGLKSLSFYLSEKGVVDASLVQATYYGVNKDIVVNGALLFEALRQWPQIPGGMDLRTLGSMTRLKVLRVNSDGTIHFILDQVSLKAYRDLKGKVKLEEEIPLVVQDSIEQLKASLQGNFDITISPIQNSVGSSRSFQVSAVDIVDESSDPKIEGLKRFDFKMQLVSDSQIVIKSLSAIYYGPNEDMRLDGDGELLFAGLKILKPEANDIEALGLLNKILIVRVDEQNIIHLLYNAYSYQLFQEKEGKVHIEKGLPSNMFLYMDKLRSALGQDFSIQLSMDERSGVYRVTLFDNKEYLQIPTSGFKKLHFELESWLSEPYAKSVTGVFYTETGEVEPDAQLLFEGMSYAMIIYNEAAAFQWLNRITIKEIRKDGAIKFAAPAWTHYELLAYRNAEGRTIVEKLIPIVIDDPKI